MKKHSSKEISNLTTSSADRNRKLSILTTYFNNRHEQVKRTLNSLLLQDFNPGDVELIFLNDGGTDDILETLKLYKNRASIKYIRTVKNPHVINHSSARRNFLIKEASAPYVVFMESETLHISDTVSQILHAFRKYGEKIWYCGKVYASKEVASRDGRLKVFEHTSVDTSSRMLGPEPDPTKRISMDFVLKNPSYHVVDPKRQEPLYWCTALSKKYLLAVNGLNENLITYGWEEFDLFKRMKNIGIRRIYDPSFVSCHLPHPIALDQREKYFWFIYNKYLPFRNGKDWGTMKNDRYHTAVL